MASEAHGLTKGVLVRRLSWESDGPREMLYLYDTAAWHHEAFLKGQGIEVTTVRIPWDGKAYVSVDNGD